MILGETPEVGSGMADPYKVKEYWTEIARSAADRGRLEKLPTRRAVTKRDRDRARSQNHAVTRRSFAGAGTNYDRIQWKAPA